MSLETPPSVLLVIGSQSDFCDQARPAVINILKTVDLAGKDGVISQFTPGVFVQVNIYLCFGLSVLALQIGINRFFMKNGFF